MHGLKVLLPKKATGAWRQSVKQLVNFKPLKPFAPLALAFIHAVSKALTDKKQEITPELRQLTRWMSKAHLSKLYQDYASTHQNRICLPRGVALHFTPANVESLLIYSWFISLLMGNSNIIRVSRAESSQFKFMLKQLNFILRQKRFRAIRERNLILSYGHQQEITKELSQYCNLRIIWGGDQTIKEIRAIPLPPRATEVVFANRFSLAALKASAVLAATNREIGKLLDNFYRDTLGFSQRGCFSPKLLFWIGPQSKVNRAKRRLWSAMEKFAIRKKSAWRSFAIARMATGYRFAAEGMADRLFTAGSELPYRVHLQKFKKNLREIHSGGGIFLEAERKNIVDICALIVPKDQTLAVYGFSESELKDFAWRLNGYGLDRIVSIGQAANFQTVWDGYDLFTYFTREVALTL